MAGVYWIASTAGITTGTSLKTLAQVVAATNVRLRIKRIALTLVGTTTDPSLVRIVVQTSAGTMSSLTPAKLNAGDDETLQVTAQHTATAEPTTTTEKRRGTVASNGRIEWRFAGDELLVPGGGKLGVQITTDTSRTAYVEIEGEE